MADYYDSYFRAGSEADRPDAGIAGRLYLVLDNAPRLTRDNGESWDDLLNLDNRYYTETEIDASHNEALAFAWMGF